MITIRLGRLKSKIVYFAEKPRLVGALGFDVYNYSTSTKTLPLFVRSNSHTKIIDLRQAEEDIFSRFNATARRYIRRAFEEGVTCDAEQDFDKFISFYCEFTQSKSMPVFSAEALRAHRNYLTFLKATSGQEILCMHSYLLDENIGRVMLLTSSSLFRRHDPLKKGLIGRANRYLHYRAMLMFKEAGYSIYDFGGYALDTKDPDLQGINEFKDQFGGKLVRESNYASYPRAVIQHIRKLMGPR